METLEKAAQRRGGGATAGVDPALESNARADEARRTDDESWQLDQTAATTRRRPRSGALALAVDVLMLVAAGIAEATYVTARGDSISSVAWFGAFAAVAILVFSRRRLYARRIRVQLLEELRTIMGTTAVTIMALMVLRVVLGETDVAGDATRHWLFLCGFVAAGRIASTRWQLAARRRG
jgi:hypothetical protein